VFPTAARPSSQLQHHSIRVFELTKLPSTRSRRNCRRQCRSRLSRCQIPHHQRHKRHPRPESSGARPREEWHAYMALLLHPHPVLTYSSTRQRRLPLVPIRSPSPPSARDRRMHLVAHRLLHLGRNLRQRLSLRPIPPPEQRRSRAARCHVHDEPARVHIRTFG
jgi:hypothetical protein